jgi:cytochrome bd-type quinol oxidase subunit 1
MSEKKESAIVAWGGWFKREIRFKPFHFIAGTASLISGTFTGIVGGITAYDWFVGEVKPESLLLKSTCVGMIVTLCLIVLTTIIGKED